MTIIPFSMQALRQQQYICVNMYFIVNKLYKIAHCYHSIFTVCIFYSKLALILY